MDHTSLEHEFATQFHPLSFGVKATNAPSIRRDTIFLLLHRAAQIAQQPSELLKEAGYLSATGLQLHSYAFVEFHPDQSTFTFGTVANGANNTQVIQSATSEQNRSSFHFAKQIGHPIVIANSATETRFRDQLLLDRGYTSGIICPINYREQNYGGIGTFAREAHTFDKDDVLFLQSIALFIGPAMAHQRLERIIAEHTHLVSSTIDSLDAIVLLLNAEGSVLQINRMCQNLGGFTVSELRGRRIWSAFWQPEEAYGAESIISELRNGTKQAKRDAYFVSKQGAVRRVSWTFVNLHEEHSHGPAILATGVDISEQHQAIRAAEDSSSHHNSRVLPSQSESVGNKSAGSFGRPGERKARKHDRRPYQCIQMVAPCMDGELPELDQFREVRCYDISPGGFSFLLPSRPNFDELVAAFGAANSRLYLRAKVKHISPIQYEGHKVLLIGCEYLGRIRMPDSA